MSKTILITGATDGLGKEVARRLAAQDWKVLLHGRNPEKGQSVLSELQKATGNTSLQYFNADLSSLADVLRLAEEVQGSQERLDILVNNAGIGPRTPDSKRSLSVDGVELFFAVNYLAGYLLTRELLPLILHSTPARIINVSSIAQAPVNFADVMLEQDYSDGLAYRQSKLAQILHANDLAEQHAASELTVNSLHPATLMSTKMVQDSTALPASMTTVDDGAEALEYLITAAALENTTGCYFDEKEMATPDAQANDPDARKQLRALSESLITAALK